MTTATLNDVNLAAVAELVGSIQNDPERAQTVWKAEVTWNGAFRSEAKVRDFEPVPSDEPAGLGGEDSAPNPVEQLLAALGNCLVVGYAANASVLGIELHNVTVEIDGDLDLHTFLGLNPDGNAGFEAIRAAVHIDADATDQQIQSLHDQVVATSPVGHTLRRSIPVVVSFA